MVKAGVQLLPLLLPSPRYWGDSYVPSGLASALVFLTPNPVTETPGIYYSSTSGIRQTVYVLKKTSFWKYSNVQKSRNSDELSHTPGSASAIVNILFHAWLMRIGTLTRSRTTRYIS